MPGYRLRPEPQRARGDIIVGDPGERRKDSILIGKIAESGPSRNLWLDITGEQVVAVFGKRGTGKSYTLGVLIEGLGVGAGESSLGKAMTPRGALVFDIMDIFWTSSIPLNKTGPPQVVRQYEEMTRRRFTSLPIAVDVWIPAGFENSGIDPPGVKKLFIAPYDMSLDDWGGLFDIDIYSEPRGMLIADVLQHVAREGYSRDDGTRVPPKANFSFEDIISCLEDDVNIRNNYQDVTIRSVRQRFVTYSTIPLFMGSGTSLGDLIRPFRSTILMLGRPPDALKKVIVSVLVRGILRNRRDVSFAQKRLDLDSTITNDDRVILNDFVKEGLPRTWVLMDEAHVLVGSDQSTIASEAIVKMAKEGRNYGLSLAVATQQPNALDPKILSQVETLISHQLTSPQDATIAARAMRSPLPEEIEVDGASSNMEGLLKRLSQGEAVFSCGNAPSLLRGCVINIRPRVTAHGGYEA